MKATIALLCLLGLALQASAAIVYRHQFQYVVKDNSPAGIAAVEGVWTYLIDNAPADGTPLNYALGKDLGISSTLYQPVPGAVNSVQASFAGRVEFGTEASLKSFWAKTANDPLYTDMVSNKLASATRIQYTINKCAETTQLNKRVYRHSFEYAFPSNATDDLYSLAELVWTRAATACPVTPLAAGFGNDLGLGSSLYPSNNPNYDFGGSLDFATQADLTAFWKWLYPQSDYQSLIKVTTGATRVQYSPYV